MKIFIGFIAMVGRIRSWQRTVSVTLTRWGVGKPHPVEASFYEGGRR